MASIIVLGTFAGSMRVVSFTCNWYTCMVEKLISVIPQKNSGHILYHAFGEPLGKPDHYDWICLKNICPYVAEIRKEYDLPLYQRSLLVFDSFRGQIKSHKLHRQATKYGFICQ